VRVGVGFHLGVERRELIEHCAVVVGHLRTMA
jgi:hypothetical protein